MIKLTEGGRYTHNLIMYNDNYDIDKRISNYFNEYYNTNTTYNDVNVESIEYLSDMYGEVIKLEFDISINTQIISNKYNLGNFIDLYNGNFIDKIRFYIYGDIYINIDTQDVYPDDSADYEKSVNYNNELSERICDKIFEDKEFLNGLYDIVRDFDSMYIDDENY